MKNDLTSFEKDLLKLINLENDTRYTYKHLMEWNTKKKTIQSKLKEGEIMYNVFGCFVAIKP
jgi:hypothetical protein